MDSQRINSIWLFCVGIVLLFVGSTFGQETDPLSVHSDGSVPMTGALYINKATGGEMIQCMAVNSGDSFIQVCASDASAYLFTNRGPSDPNTGYIKGGGTGTISSHPFMIRTDNTDRMIIMPDGKVGIGTTNPAQKLDIEGGVLRLGSRGDGLSSIYFEPCSTHHMHIYTDSNGRLYFHNVQSGIDLVSIKADGNVGIGTGTPSQKLTVRGNILVEDSSGNSVLELGTGLDYSEGFDLTKSEEAAPGTVLVIDENNPGRLTVSTNAYDTKVAGIVAGAKGLGSGVRLGVDDYDCDVALAGRVYCNVDATESGIRPGDLLTTSPTAGYAMKVGDPEKSLGAIIGKAMESLEEGKKGQILVLVNLP